MLCVICNIKPRGKLVHVTKHEKSLIYLFSLYNFNLNSLVICTIVVAIENSIEFKLKLKSKITYQSYCDCTTTNEMKAKYFTKILMFIYKNEQEVVKAYDSPEKYIAAFTLLNYYSIDCYL